jgi:hypothetical protein
METLRTRTLARARSEHLARVEDAERVERALDGMVEVEPSRAELLAEEGTLERADAVLSGDGAAQLERGAEDVIEGGARPLQGRGVVPVEDDA